MCHVNVIKRKRRGKSFNVRKCQLKAGKETKKKKMMGSVRKEKMHHEKLSKLLKWGGRRLFLLVI